MKRKVSLAILGTMLQGSAHATEPGTTGDPALITEPIAHSAQATEKKTGVAHVKKAKPRTKAGAEQVEPQTEVKQDAVTETPPGSIEQSVQLRGVRG